MYRKIFLVLWAISFLSSCGDNNKVDIRGDDSSKLLAEKMLVAMGGKKLWANLKSIHIRTIHRDGRREYPSVSEIWANIDEKKTLTLNASNDRQSVKVVHGNDGWEIKNGEMLILPTEELYPMLRWYRFNFYTNMKRLATGGEQYEIKLNGKQRFDIYENGEYVGGFELNDDNLPFIFYSPGIFTGVKENFLKFVEWDAYGGYSFPKIITGENTLIINETEFFEASSKPAEKAFQVSFDPVELTNKY